MYPELRNVNAIGIMFQVHATEAGLPFRAVVTYSRKKPPQASRQRGYPEEEPQYCRMISVFFVGENNGWFFQNVKGRAGGKDMEGQMCLEHRSKLNMVTKKRSPFSMHAFSTGQLE